jgi:hypothetical protein
MISAAEIMMARAFWKNEIRFLQKTRSELLMPSSALPRNAATQ